MLVKGLSRLEMEIDPQGTALSTLCCVLADCQSGETPLVPSSLIQYSKATVSRANPSILPPPISSLSLYDPGMPDATA